jgi:Ca2+-binding RTX toxin-like protein
VSAGAGDDVIVRVGLSLSVDCGAGNDVVIILGAAQAGPLPFTGFQDFYDCERKEGVTDPAQIAKLGAVVDDATNRGRRVGDEAAVAAASPLTLAARYNRIEGSPIADVITTRPGVGFGYPLGFSRDAAGNVFQFAQQPPPDGAVTSRDLVFGNSGDDVIHSGPDNDHLEGEKGDDTLHGEDGNDVLYGRTGADRLFGGPGDDLLEGGRGDDRLDGGPGRDELVGGIGGDRVDGGAGSDRITTVDGTRDSVDCGPGRDSAIVDRRDRVRRCERITRSSGRS